MHGRSALAWVARASSNSCQEPGPFVVPTGVNPEKCLKGSKVEKKKKKQGPTGGCSRIREYNIGNIPPIHIV